jgi:exopolyphosphatase/guanosine-5'-triphosphate,3'-diphosphate pyrophosphatase
MIAAALDMGSNTLRLLVAQVDGGKWQALERGLASPRLGRGLKAGTSLSATAKKAALDAAAGFTARARELGAERIALAATQACRKAVDGEDFVASLGRELDLDSARVISGAEEAALSRRGVLSRLTGGEGSATGSWLADIGGGSTEIMDLGQPEAPVLSLELGAVTLTEAHITNDPPDGTELEALKAAVNGGLLPLINCWQGRRCSRLIVTAGTAATLAALRLGMTIYQPEEINNLEVSRGDLIMEYNRLTALPLRNRQTELALEPQRADIIIAGLAILRGLVEGLGLESFITMDAGLLEGILLEHAALA